jgi:hypothetical protein
MSRAHARYKGGGDPSFVTKDWKRSSHHILHLFRPAQSTSMMEPLSDDFDFENFDFESFYKRDPDVSGLKSSMKWSCS